jgi:anti-sigma B factor antagonist
MLTVQKNRLIIEEREDISIVTFTDEKILDESDIQVLGNQLFQLVDQQDRRKLILDFSCVKYMSSAMLGRLIHLKKKLNAVHGDLRLCNISPEILPIFQITKTDKLFSMHDNVEDALV